MSSRSKRGNNPPALGCSRRPLRPATNPSDRTVGGFENFGGNLWGPGNTQGSLKWEYFCYLNRTTGRFESLGEGEVVIQSLLREWGLCFNTYLCRNLGGLIVPHRAPLPYFPRAPPHFILPTVLVYLSLARSVFPFSLKASELVARRLTYFFLWSNVLGHEDIFMWVVLKSVTILYT